MNNTDKRIAKLFNKKEARFGEIKTILNSIGYELIRVRGSHHMFKNKKGLMTIFPVHNNFVKKCYIKKIIKKINQLHDEEMSL